jgi:hypothetical protein
VLYSKWLHLKLPELTDSQRHWDLVKEDVVQAVMDILNGGILPVGLNDTSIMLIPKVKHP